MKPTRLLRLNVGFILKESTGYRRKFEFNAPEAQLADDLNVADLRGHVTLSRTPQGIYAEGHLSAEAAGECVRCLDDLALPLTAHIAELFIYPPENARPGELVVPEDAMLDLTPMVREDMLLSAPMQAVCRTDCQGLCPHCGANRNLESCTCVEDSIDPRLAVLGAFLEN
ncbi:MAG TPA: DUF177 domain-containing protein [Anaerolineales bacterium]